MKAIKYKICIVVSVLSVDAAPAMILAAVNEIEREKHEGQLRASDGDFVTWTTESEEVEF